MNSHNDDIELISIQSQAPGKVIISGEHSVVYGKPALCFSIDKYTTCTITLKRSNTNELFCKCNLPNINESLVITIANVCDSDSDGNAISIENSFMFTHIMSIIHSILTAMNQTLRELIAFITLHRCYLNVTITSSIPVGFGLGSSAAFNVSLVLALNALFSKVFSIQPLSKQTLTTISNNAEKTFHSTPSGIDVVTSLYGSFIIFKTINDFIHESNFNKFSFITSNYDVILLNTNKSRDCKEFINKVSTFKKEHFDLFQQNLNDIETITNNIISLITSYDGNNNQQHNINQIKETFTQLITQNQRHLVNIQVSNDIIDHIINVLHKNGFHNCKITGAGGGGFILLFIEKENICKFNALCKEEHFNILKVNIDSKGAYVKQ